MTDWCYDSLFFSKIYWCYDTKKQDWCFATKKINVLILFFIGGMIPEKNDKNKLVFYYHLVGGTRWDP